MSAEDIYPNWARAATIELFPPIGQSPARVKGRICKRCNGRLNDEFEKPTRFVLERMVRGEAMRLAPKRQKLVSRWILKTMLVRVLVSPDYRGFLPHWKHERMRALLLRLMSGASLPDGALIRVATVWPIDDGAMPQSRPFGIPAHFRDQCDLSSVAWVGHLGWECSLAPGLDPLHFANVTEHDTRLIRIWPPSLQGVSWPASEPVLISDLHALRFEWGHAKDRIMTRESELDVDKYLFRQSGPSDEGPVLDEGA